MICRWQQVVNTSDDVSGEAELGFPTGDDQVNIVVQTTSQLQKIANEWSNQPDWIEALNGFGVDNPTRDQPYEASPVVIAGYLFNLRNGNLCTPGMAYVDPATASPPPIPMINNGPQDPDETDLSLDPSYNDVPEQTAPRLAEMSSGILTRLPRASSSTHRALPAPRVLAALN